MKCPKCSVENEDDAVSCNLCGVSFRQDVATHVPSTNDMYVRYIEYWHIPSAVELCFWLVLYAIIIFSPFAYWLFDRVNIPTHELGHVVFGWAFQWLCYLGGTIMQLFFPAVAMVTFWFRRQLAGVVFGFFWLGVNFINIGIYMSDARAMKGQYVNIGGGVLTDTDWSYLFRIWGLLRYDTTIGGAMNIMGWITMIGAIAWLLLFSLISYKKNGWNFFPES